MNDDTEPKVLRFFTILVLVIGVLGLGASGLCGAAFTFMGVMGLFEGGPENYSGAILVFSVPSLLIGGGLAWWLGRTLAKQLRARS